MSCNGYTQLPKSVARFSNLLEQKILPGKSNDKGRPGLDLWQIPVLGIVSNARDCDYDEPEDLASQHTLIHQFLNLPAIAGSDLTNTPDLTHRTISNNVCHITEELLQGINKKSCRNTAAHSFSKKGRRGNHRKM